MLAFVLAWLLTGGEALAGAPDTTSTILAPGDVIKVVVYNRPELTGTYPVGPEGAVRLPLVGTVSVAGSAMEAVQTMLARRISSLLDYEAPVTVDMARYRPVFVVGAVARPGEHDYTPGLLVMQLVARAGGISLSGSEAVTEVTPLAAMRARQELLTTLLDVQALSIRQAALDDLLNGSDNLSRLKDIQGIGDAKVLQSSLDDQQALMDISRKRLQVAGDFTQRLQTQLDEEVQALLNEEKALTRQAALVAQELQTVQSLRNEGLTTSSRMLSQQNMDAEIKVDLHRVATYLSRVRQEKIELERRLQDTEHRWRQDHVVERAKVAVDLAQARAKLAAARSGVAAMGLELLSEAGDIPVPSDARFVISRPGPGGLQEIEAARATPLQAGDILHVYLPEVPASAGVLSQLHEDHVAAPQNIHSEHYK